ncbi:MAG: glycosyltransferase family 2 protein [Candidatus Kerfeldbacteria bacterium]|nr:glycosyltransferase family 2 protein [Candidatus Kerfeldbacteria bacterium]
MQQADTAVIVLNWNGRQHLETCLASVCRQDSVRAKIFLVDNGSRDGSVEYVRNSFPEVTIVANKKNVGFAEGNNIGIRAVLEDSTIRFIAVLNNDTEVDAGWLRALHTAIERDVRIGAVASRMMNFFQRDVFDSAGDYLLPHAFKVVTRGAGEKDRGQYAEENECFIARGGAALYRREMLEDICLDGDYFDRHFFAYIEDTDLSVRARLRGWKIVYAPSAVVYHKVSATVNTLASTFRLFHSGRNRIFFAIKNLPISLWPAAVRDRAALAAGTGGTLVRAWLFIRIGVAALIALPRLFRQRLVIGHRRTLTKRDILDWQRMFSI